MPRGNQDYAPPTDENGRYLEEGFTVTCRKCGDIFWANDAEHKKQLERRSIVGPLAGRNRFMCRACMAALF